MRLAIETSCCSSLTGAGAFVIESTDEEDDWLGQAQTRAAHRRGGARDGEAGVDREDEGGKEREGAGRVYGAGDGRVEAIERPSAQSRGRARRRGGTRGQRTRSKISLP